MGDENPTRTLGDYSRSSHGGYSNTIEFPEGNNMVPLRSDTIRLVQNGCSFHELWFEDPNQHLKDFLKLVDSLDLDGENRERTRLRLTPKIPSSWHRSLASSPNLYDHVNPVTRRTIDQSTGGKLRDLNPEESWAILEDLALYDNESWNDPRDFAKLVKAITLPQDVPSTFDCRLIELETQVQRLVKAHLASTQLNKITSSCEICSGPHDTQTCMENPEQAFVEYASSCTDEAGEGMVSKFMASQDARLSRFEADFKQQQSEMSNKINTVLKAITDRIAGTLPSDTVKNPTLGTHPVSSVSSYPIIDPQCSCHPSTSINAIKAHFNDAITEPQQPEEPKPTLKNEFKDLHLNLPVLEVLAKNNEEGIEFETDEYAESLEIGKNRSAFVQSEPPAKIGDPALFTLPWRGFLATANAIIDFRMAKIAVGEGITRSIFSVKGIELGEEEAPYWTTLGKRESYKP
ncbi:hypothetical protein Tco_0439777 [Tanacetum coccineum]